MTAIPVALVLLVGIALGPQAMGFLSPAILSSLDPAVPVALAVLGVLVGLGINLRRGDDRFLMAVAAFESLLTVAAVASGLVFAASLVTTSTALPVWLLAIIIGICAASSLTLPSARLLERLAPASRVIELDVLVPIVAGGFVLALVRQGSLVEARSLALPASAVVLVLAVSGWLLLSRASSDTERRVFAVATLLLVGGAADFLSFSALLGGLLAGIFWRIVGGPARESIHRDTLYVQHPLVVLVLVVAGARAEFTATTLGLAGLYIVLRTIGRVLGASVATRLASTLPRDLGQRLLTPGVFGVAFALNAVRAMGADASIVLAIAVAGTIGSELVFRLVTPREASV